ncbi:hypothetical protein GQ43DRAFT_381101 [Delitschia confertaspora ATCC 74209]|uniref:Uncharacterized protein n=1 Tax=Delitschia confertaspora ATCC 74209 TaxID=1513339 RepID=A0A9P4JFL6_9PLEO|nr:hypothetical protein GQ43DRAFT_381101 [Delitschia confertaspora ATCC 74209]
MKRFLQFFSGGIYALDGSTYDPIEILLNSEDPEERDILTERWKDSRVNELNFIGIVAALLAGVLTSTGSWPPILPSGQLSPWPVRTSWYCGIVLSLFSILTAADQTVRLHRLASHRDRWRIIRNLLVKKNRHGQVKRSRRTGRLLPNTIQVFAWQLPTMFLTTAAICMVAGMFLHVWSATRHLTHELWWNSDSKVASTYTVVAALSIGLFLLSQITLYNAPYKDEEESGGSSCSTR